MARADFEVLPGVYVFQPLGDGITSFRKDALAVVRDNGAWSQLVPVENPRTAMAFRVLSFDFDPALDATGFVGWLHSHLARTTGTGHVVVCGCSARGQADHVRGGIFDYWGCPAGAADRVLAEERAPIDRARGPRRAHIGVRGGCLVCEAAEGAYPGFSIVAEGPRAVGVLKEIDPRARGHCVFFPRRYVPNLHDLEDAETAEILSLLKRVTIALDLKEYHVLQNNGARAGQTVFHAHVHLVPKPTAAAGLIVQGGLLLVDQTGLAEEIQRRLGARRDTWESRRRNG
jgi:diadenosine tetraphosphate (Ap4A) HIT family hydrolase